MRDEPVAGQAKPIEEAIDTLNCMRELAYRTEHLADHLLGSRPTPGSGEGNIQDKPDGRFPSLMEAIEQARGDMTRIAHALERIESET